MTISGQRESLSALCAEGSGLRPLTVCEYERAVEAGVFPQGERIELLGGLLFEMSPQGCAHAHAVRVLTIALSALHRDRRAILQVQLPVRLSGESMPEPDLCLARWREDSYRDHPEASDLHLVVEVGDSSAGSDRSVKLPLYADAGVREYWLVSLGEQVVLVFRDPEPGTGGYRAQQRICDDGILTPLEFPECMIECRSIF